MNNEVATKEQALMAAVERAITTGDVAALNVEQRLYYYKWKCDEAGLKMSSRPFDFLNLSGKVVLYAKKDATDQLRKIHGVSIIKIEKEITDGMCIVTAYARDKNGKEDCDMGAVPIGHLKGDAYANGLLKCITKAKRRVTLSICGIGVLDESELDTVSNAKIESIDLAEQKTNEKTEALKAKLAPPKEPEVVPAAKKVGRPSKVEVEAKKQQSAPSTLPPGASEEPEVVPPPPMEDPHAFFDAKPEPVTPNDFFEIAVERIRSGKSEDELRTAWTKLYEDFKDPKKINVRGIPPEIGIDYSKRARAVLDARKVEIGLAKK